MNYHIITYGCQMNLNDTERIKYLFESSGHIEASEKEADFIIINACSVRGRVVDKILGKINQIKNNKIKILTGCVLGIDKEKLSSKFDYFLTIDELPYWGEKIKELQKIEVKNSYFEVKARREKPIAYIPIMTGCDNFCSYCAVPYVRGKERSRPMEEILEEIRSLIKDDFKEIWLLGQNVNSYNKGLSPDFSDLLEEVSKIEGDFWIRFTSSHPKDFSEKLIKTIKNSSKITNYLNLPIQSGDDTVLKLMNRPYDVTKYKEIIKKVRKEIPEITLSTDIIVGFPGETEEAFQNTKKLLEEIVFDMAYIAQYSPRPQTKADKMKDNISQKEKKRREKELNEILKKTSYYKNKEKIGQIVEYLPLYHKNKNNIGKTKCYKTVAVKDSEKEIRKIKKIKIIEADSFGLKAILYGN